jgi:hypothetical protein
VPTLDHHQLLECARVRIGAALLEVHHITLQHREAMHRLEQAYMDLGNVMTSTLAANADGDAERVDRL